MATEEYNGKQVPVIEVAKSPSGGAPKSDNSITAENGGMISTYNAAGVVNNDTMTTKQVVAPSTLPLDYQYDEKQMMANVSVAISADIEDMTEREMLEDETFGYASKKMFKSVMGQDFTGTDEEATQYGIDLMRRVENNLVSLGDFSNQVSSMNQDDARIALYMMDMFEAKNFTGRGFAEALGYMGLDPTTYLGIGTLGYGFAGKQAAKVTTKTAMRTAIEKIAYSNMAVGAIEGGGYTAAFEHGKQKISEAAGQGYDSGSVGLNAAIGTVAGGAAGKYLPELFDYAEEKVTKWAKAKNFKAEVQMAADAGDVEAQMILDDMALLDNHFDSDGTMREQLAKSAVVEEEMAVQAGGGTPPKQTADEMIAAAKDMTPKQKQRHFGAAMKDAAPEDKQKYIAAMKADAPAPKPKTVKQQAKIDEREDFNEHFYSRLEHEMNKIPDDMRFETGKDYIDYLKKQGVKQDEIDASGIQDTVDGYGSAYVTGGGVEQTFMRTPRGDVISKRVYTDEDFGGSDGSMSREDWESEWTTETQGEVRTGEQGYGTIVTDDYTGQQGEIGYSYADDRYVDDSNYEYTYEELKDDYLTNYADDYIETAKSDMAEEIADGSADDGDVLEAAWELADNDSAWNDYYYNKEQFELEDGQIFDDLDDAREALLDNMHSDYESMGAEREGNSFEGYTVDGGDDYRMEVYQMEDFTSSKDLHQEPHLGEDYSNEMEFGNDNVQVHARIKTREDDDGKTGDVLEEVQSQWEQDWRGSGGATPPSEDVVKKAEARTAEIKNEYEAKKKEKAEYVEKIGDEKVVFSDLNKEEKYLSQETDMAATDEAGYIKEIERIMKEQNDSVLRKTEYERDRDIIQREITSLNDEAKKLDKEVISWTPSETATPPIQKRTQYEKVVLLDNITQSIKDDKDYFGWINGHIQNGSATPSGQLTGMTQAYDKEMPRIVQKATGETPYMQGFDGAPVLDDDGKKIYWDVKKVQDENYYNAQNAGQDWHWRIDLTDALKAKLKDAKIQMYGVGGAALVGANGVSLEGEDNAN